MQWSSNCSYQLAVCICTHTFWGLPVLLGCWSYWNQWGVCHWSQWEQHIPILCLQFKLVCFKNLFAFYWSKYGSCCATGFPSNTIADEREMLKTHWFTMLKKMAHLLLHKCYIHSVFCYIDRNFFELLAAGWKGFISNTLKFDTGYKSAINQQWKLENKMRSNSSRTISSYNTP